jgi:hypothetical protein
MAKIGPGFKALLDRSRPRPVVGAGYLVEVRSRDAVRYIEEDRCITMFSDLIHRIDEPYWGNKFSKFLSRILGEWCLGVYIEDPIVWDDDDLTVIPLEHQQLILQRVEAALKQKCRCFRIDRGPNQQHNP